MTGRDEGSRRAVRALDAVGLTAAGAGVVLLLAYLVGSLIFTGGRVGATLEANYEQIVPWPLFEVPAWLAIGLAVLAMLAFVPMAWLARPAESKRIMRAINLTLGGICVASLVWTLAFPSSVGADTWPEPTPTVWGDHWIAIVIGVATVALLLAVGWRKLGASDRDRRA